MASVSAGMAAIALTVAYTLLLSVPVPGMPLRAPGAVRTDTSHKPAPDTPRQGQDLYSLLPDFKVSDSVMKQQASSLLHQTNPLRKLKRDSLRFPKFHLSNPSSRPKKAPIFAFKGGQVGYNFLYRSTIDTPYSEKDITQHILTGSLSFNVAGFIPLRVNYWLRKSNSVLFRDITDVQLQFDPGGFRNTLIENARKQWTSAASLLDDSLADKLYALKSQALKRTADWLRSPLTTQKLREYRELLQIPSMTYDPNLPDSANKKRADSLQQQAKLFLETYSQTKARYDSLKLQADSLEGVAKKTRARMQQYRALASSKPGDWLSYTRWQEELKKYQPSMPVVPDKYKWLMGIRSFSLGRTPVNTSELTAKNVSLTGIHFEYNTWYYLSVTAGLVDYRFRDFVAGRFGSTPQYLYMLRAGIGRLEKNYVIVSLSRGRKQLYASTNGSVPTSINITGVSVETRWQIHRTSSLVAEVAQSLSPDYRTQPVTNSKFSLDGGLNKALSLKWRSYFPKTHSLVEGMYKYTGANYQSFSSFQTNAAMKTWYVKWEQSFFDRQLRVTGALRANEFSNPFILQDYRSNTVFKSINAVFKRRKWPVLTVGYVPMSQLTVIDNQVLENRFQTLTASFNHFYKLGTRQTSSTIVYNRFYNHSSDTGFVYYNAVNVFYAQNLLFNHFTVGYTISRSTGSQYALNTLEGNIYLNLKRVAPGFGIKISSLNRTDTRAGGYVNCNIRLSRKDMIYVNYEHGYLPGTGRQLIRNDMGSVQYSRAF